MKHNGYLDNRHLNKWYIRLDNYSDSTVSCTQYTYYHHKITKHM